MNKPVDAAPVDAAMSQNPPPAKGVGAEDVRAIGEIIRDTRNLTAEQVASILAHQRENGVRFGEAAIALGLATPDDVLQALAQQFNYAVGTAERLKLSPELVAYNQPYSQQAEAFRAIRTQIARRASAAGETRLHRAIAVVSPDSGDGKTFFCANLGVALAQLGGRTLIVDADLRGPRLHDLFALNAQSGLSGLLSGRRGEAVIKTVKGIANLFVLPVGVMPPNPLELVEGPGFAALLQELLNRFDHVIVDTPAAVYGADAATIASRCGSALVVVRKDHARVEALQDLLQMLHGADATVAGVVMNEF